MERRDSLTALRDRLRGGVVGQDTAVDNLLVALLADGHVLLEGAPGLAKTRLARLIASAFEGRFNRVQFTPDMMPSDLTGSAVLDPGTHSFEFREGPVFGNFLLADEINRAPAKVQSALLEAMEERQVTSGDRTHRLPVPFFVIATQNPIEHEGTWELPQAQLDRFLLNILIDYPSGDAELEILDLVLGEAVAAAAEAHGAGAAACAPTSFAVLAEARRQVLAVHLSPPVREYIIALVTGTRDAPARLDGVGEHLAHPVSPRGSLALARAGQARAWLDGRDYVLPEDVSAVAPDALRHRIGLTYRAEADGISPGAVIAALLDQVHAV